MFHAFTKLKKYEPLPENYDSFFKMFCGFAAQFDVIFPDSKKASLAKGGWEQALLWVSPSICSRYTLSLSWISSSSQNNEGMMQLLINDALLFNCRNLTTGRTNIRQKWLEELPLMLVCIFEGLKPQISKLDLNLVSAIFHLFH